MEHAKFKGVRSAAAKQFFIKELSLMENYGIEYHLAKNESGHSLHIGVGSEEIKIYDEDLNFVERYELNKGWLIVVQIVIVSKGHVQAKEA